jgi:hypothetical protein
MGLGRKRERAGGSLAKRPSSSPARIRTERGEGASGWPAGGARRRPRARRRPAIGGGKERRPREFDSSAHLELGRRREVDRREDSGVAAVLGGGGAVELVERGEGCCEAAVVRCGGLGSRRPLL